MPAWRRRVFHAFHDKINPAVPVPCASTHRTSAGSVWAGASAVRITSRWAVGFGTVIQLPCPSRLIAEPTDSFSGRPESTSA